ncbi:hypothetical protein, partial [Gudongella sp.]
NEEIKEIEVCCTILDGRIVFENHSEL